MSSDRHAEIAKELDAIAAQMGTLPVPAQEQLLDSWVGGVDAPDRNFAKLLVQIRRAKSELSCPTGNVAQVVQHHHHYYGPVHQMNEQGAKMERSVIQQAGGNMTGVAAGHIYKSMIQQFQGDAANSGNLDAPGAALFSSVFKEADAIADGEEKDAIAQQLLLLREEIAKPQPKKSLVSMAWGALIAFMDRLPTLVQLGKWIVAKFGWVLPAC